MKFRKRPLVIDAIQYKGNFEEAARFTGNKVYHIGNSELYIYIRSLEGDHKCMRNDWIIKGVKGEFYSCKNDIFEQTYEICEGQ